MPALLFLKIKNIPLYPKILKISKNILQIFAFFVDYPYTIGKSFFYKNQNASTYPYHRLDYFDRYCQFFGVARQKNNGAVCF